MRTVVSGLYKKFQNTFIPLNYYYLQTPPLFHANDATVSCHLPYQQHHFRPFYSLRLSLSPFSFIILHTSHAIFKHVILTSRLRIYALPLKFRKKVDSDLVQFYASAVQQTLTHSNKDNCSKIL